MLRQGTFSLWSIQDGLFHSIPLAETPIYNEITAKVRSIAIPEGDSLFIRGSMVEEHSPHPKSDIDFFYVGDVYQGHRISKEIELKLNDLNRPVEVAVITKYEAETSDVYRLLLQTRSKHIAGKPMVFAPVKANFKTMQSHYNRYGAFMVSDVLSGAMQRRVCELKQLTRSFAISHFFLHQQFSRDIFTCVKWAKQIDLKAGNLLENYWHQLDDSLELPNMEVRYIKQVLFHTCNLAVKVYKNENI